MVIGKDVNSGDIILDDKGDYRIILGNTAMGGVGGVGGIQVCKIKYSEIQGHWENIDIKESCYMGANLAWLSTNLEYLVDEGKNYKKVKSLVMTMEEIKIALSVDRLEILDCK